MFKRKKKKTGVQTPTYRRFSMAPNPNLGWQPTKSSGTKPLKPPTSGSNVVKPNPNYVPPASVTKPRTIVCAMKLEELDDWVKTRAQIGDVAYCHDRISNHHYIYHYRKPDDNPVWIMMQPELLTDYLHKTKEQEHKMEYKIDIDAMIKERLDKIVDKPCPYELPCGYCTKWDKKCDKKIGCGDDKPQRGLRAESNVYDDNCHIPKGIIRKIIQEVVDYEKAMNELKEITKGATNEYSTE